MKVNVNQDPEKENSNEIRVTGPINLPTLIIFTIFSVGFIALSIFGMKGAFNGGSVSSGWILIGGMGIIMFLLAMVYFLSYFKVKGNAISLIMGVVFILIPVFTFIINPLIGILFFIFGFIGVYMIIKAINSIRGKKEENIELDTKISSMVNSTVRKAADIEEKESEYAASRELTDAEIELAEKNLAYKVKKIESDSKPIVSLIGPIVFLVCSGFISIPLLIIGIVFVAVGDDVFDLLTGYGTIGTVVILFVIGIVLFIKTILVNKRNKEI